MSRRVAVLGAGIMGCSTALHFARRGMGVTLYDAAAVPFSGASRWNEGKIHLGFLYSADPTLRTAARVLPGGLRFGPLVEELLDCSIDAAISPGDDLYLCHRDSVVGADAMEDYVRRVADLARQHPDAGAYLADVADLRAHRLAPAELAAVTPSPDIVAGFRSPERSVSTAWIADRFVSAICAEPRIEQRMATRITAAQPSQHGEVEGRWRVLTADGGSDDFDVVVNALWSGRLEIDETAGLPPPPVWSHRYRLSVFLRTAAHVDAPCAIIAAGPFGDVKNYNGRDFYLSWYPAGLQVDSDALSPPQPPSLDEPERQALCRSVLDHLEAVLPDVARVRAAAETMTLEGGWVFAAGQGRLSDPAATLHRRSDFGITRLGSYISVDTGKYSTAPWLARRLADGLG